MIKYIWILLLTTICGCSALKEQTGTYVTEAVRDKIVNDIENLLEKRSLSLKEIKQVTDSNNDGKITREDITSTVKSTAKDYILFEAKTYVEQKMKENQASLQEHAASKNDLESKTREFWQLVLGLVAAYLTKQVWSAKSDGKRDERIAVLEKLLNQDIDGDGTIGTVTDPNKANNPKPTV